MTSNQTDSVPGLFVWRDGDSFYCSGADFIADAFYPDIQIHCIYCHGKYKTIRSFESVKHFINSSQFGEQGYKMPLRGHSYHECTTCGFSWESRFVGGDPGDRFGGDSSRDYTYISKIKKFEINNAYLSLEELGTHLKRNISDIYSLAPRRFEQLVANVFKNQGYRVRLTQQTRDGGYDILLLQDDKDEAIIVECKRYAKTKKVDVSVIRELLGVQLELGVSRGKVITTSEFTSPAIQTANAVTSGKSEYEMDLINIYLFARELECYNENLPPLHLI